MGWGCRVVWGVLIACALVAEGAEAGSCAVCNFTAGAVCCNPRLGQLCPGGVACCDCGGPNCACPPTTPSPTLPKLEADVVVVGLGASGAVVLSRLVEQHPNTTFLAIEAGEAVSMQLGGTGGLPLFAANLSVVDVPGMYPTLAFHPTAKPVQLPEHPWTWLGKALGGNTQFNGMVFMVPPASDLAPPMDLSDELVAVRRAMGRVTQTPSADGKPQNTASFNLGMSAVRGSARRVDLSNLTTLSGMLYGAPSVTTNGRGLRGSVVDGYLTRILDRTGRPKVPNLKLLTNTACTELVFDGEGNVVGLRVERDGETGVVEVHQRVVLAAGALGTPRILMRSGVGPSTLPSLCPRCGYPTAVVNEGVGVVADHAGAAIEFSCPSQVAFNASDTSSPYARQFVASRSGPYAQYGPTFMLHNGTVEFFLNPFGISPTSPTTAVGVYAVLLQPKARSYVKLDGDFNTVYPNMYLRGEGDWAAAGREDMTLLSAALSTFAASFLANNRECKVSFGPGDEHHRWLDPTNPVDMESFLQPDQYGGVYYSHLIMNHFTGTVPLGKAVDPASLIVKGSKNLHVTDASLIPTPLKAHPVATVMALGERAARLLSPLL
eukprot:Sspe_Gene.77488::Locus_48426_Transcript_1_1_Confidence_1.000_Length_2872::g.77488::m.77488